jgi:hypothetical protein
MSVATACRYGGDGSDGPTGPRARLTRAHAAATPMIGREPRGSHSVLLIFVNQPINRLSAQCTRSNTPSD